MCKLIQQEIHCWSPILGFPSSKNFNLRLHPILWGNWFFLGRIFSPVCLCYEKTTAFMLWSSKPYYLLEICFYAKFEQDNCCGSLNGSWGRVEWESVHRSTRPFWSDLDFEEYEEWLAWERSGKSLNYGNGGSWQCHLFSVSRTHDRGEQLQFKSNSIYHLDICHIVHWAL